MANQSPSAQPPATIYIDVSLATVAKFLLLFLAAFVVYESWSFILLLILSALIAVTLKPLLAALTGWGHSRRAGLGMLALGFLLLFLGFIFFLFPPLIVELGVLADSLPLLRSEILHNTPRELGLHRALEKVLASPVEASKVVSGMLSLVQNAVEGAARFFMLLIFALYFLMDGPRAYVWILPYFTHNNQRKISRTLDEFMAVVSAYISGQLLTSLMAAMFSFTVLIIAGVPAALSLSVLAGIFDVLPIIGFFLFAIPACLLALTVSWETAFFVLVAYTIYHLIESYYIIPKVYGSRMRLSTTVILIGMVLAYSIAGVAGAISILPILAAYPIVERIWFAKHVGSAAVEEHGPTAVQKRETEHQPIS